MAPSVSICIPASRDPDGLRVALGSVLAQDYADLEVVVTDDSGGALEPVARAADDGRVRYHANPVRLGLAGNHTAALDRARGRYLGFLHDDDRFLPSYVSTAVAHFERDPSLGVVFSDCWIDVGDVNGTPFTRRGVDLAAGRHERFLPTVIAHDYLIPSTTVVRREVWTRGRRAWPDLVCADLALFVDAALRGWPYCYIDEPLVVYRKHPGQIGADERRHRDDILAFWDGYRFDDAAAERLRRAKLADWLVARAGTHLKQGRPAEARSDLRRARGLGPQGRSPRARALAVLASAHPALGPVAHRVWRRLRPAERAAPLHR